jgi:HPt (histidine-containing phosphotransfer) domain-containing protein
MTDTTGGGTAFDVREVLERCMGEVDLAQEILGIFEVEAPLHVSAIGLLIDAGKFDDASRRGHALKGMAANVACKALAAAAGRIELGGRAGDLNELRAGFVEAQAALAASLQALPSVVAELQTQAA